MVKTPNANCRNSIRKWLPVMLLMIVLPLFAENTNLPPNVKLLIEIRKLENKIYDLTNGVPKMYSAPSSEASTNMIVRLEEIWNEYDRTITNLNSKRIEFKKLSK